MPYRLVHSKLFVVVSLIFLLQTGCITAKKMNRYVSNHYGETVTLKKIKSDYLSVASPLVNNDNPAPSVSTMRTKKVLPLIIYWRMDYQTSCKLNPKIPINQFNAALSAQGNSKGLKQKLGGGFLEITVHSIPLSFSFNDDFSAFLFVGWEKVYLLPEKNELSLSYKLITNGAETKTGSITLPDPGQLRGTRYFQSVRSATAEYLIQYDQDIKNMAKTVVERLMTEL